MGYAKFCISCIQRSDYRCLIGYLREFLDEWEIVCLLEIGYFIQCVEHIGGKPTFTYGGSRHKKNVNEWHKHNTEAETERWALKIVVDRTKYEC